MTTQTQKERLAEAERQKQEQRVRDIANGVAMALQMQPPSEIIEIQGSVSIENLDRATDASAGSITMVFRARGAATAYRAFLRGEAIDELHNLLHEDPPVVEEPETESEPVEA